MHAARVAARGRRSPRRRRPWRPHLARLQELACDPNVRRRAVFQAPAHVCVCVCIYGACGRVRRVCVAYGPPGIDSALEVSRVPMACAVEGQCTPRVPTLRFGDFDQALVDLLASAGLERFGWADPLEGLPTSNAAVHPRLIGWTVLNRPAGARVRDGKGLGLPVHAAHWLALPAGVAPPVSAWEPARRPLPEAGGAHCL